MTISSLKLIAIPVLALLTVPSIASAQAFFLVEKQVLYAQADSTGPYLQTAQGFPSYIFRGQAPAAGTITPPGLTPINLVVSSDKNGQYNLSQAFTTKVARDAAFPNGNYQVTSTGYPAVTIGLSGDLYPTATPQVVGGTWQHNVLVVNPAQSATLNFSTFTGYTSTTGGQVAAHMSFKVQTDFGSDNLNLQNDIATVPIAGITQSSAPFTSYTIPAGTLVAGNIYQATLDFDTLTSVNTTSISGATIVGLYENELSFYIVAQSTNPPAAPVINVSPTSITTPSGSNAAFTYNSTPSWVGGSQTQAASFLWFFNGQIINSGSTSKYSFDSNINLTVNNVGAADVGTYVIGLFNGGGVAFSQPATLSIGAALAPTITAQPQNQTATAGGSASFSVSAAGTGPFVYQWYFNGTVLTLGGNTSSYFVNNVTAGKAGVYAVTVSNAGGTVTSNGANLVLVASLPAITTQPAASQSVNAGASPTLSVVASGAGTYQWQLNGTNISGATNSTLTLANIGTTQRGSYTVVVSNVLGSVTSNAANVAVAVNSSLYNISSRAYIGTGQFQNLVAGFYTNGSGSKNVVVRGIGPNLAIVAPTLAGLTLPNPKLTLYNGSAAVLATNTAWGGGSTLTSAFASVYATPLQSGSSDTAAFMSVPAGPGIGYTTQIDGLNNGSGVALVEVYDYDSYVGTPAARLINISSRAVVGTGNQSLVAGFYVVGSGSQTLLIRAVGPALVSTSAYAGLTLAKPTLTLYDASGNVVATNAGWGNAVTAGNSTTAAGIQQATTAIMNGVFASVIAPGSNDCAMVVTLPTGGSAAGYTAQVSSADTTTGLALVEVYNVP